MNTRDFATYISPFGFQLSYPIGWTPVPRGSTISFISPEDPWRQLSVMSSQVRETGLDSLQSRLLAALERKQKILHVDRLHVPRLAILVETLSSDNGVGKTYIVELLDDGKLARTCVLSILGNKGISPTKRLLEIWSQMVPEVRKAAVGYRRIGLESRGFTFEFPEGWILGNVGDYSVTMRSPVRRASQPNVVVTCGPNDASISLAALRDLAITQFQPQRPGRWLSESAAVLGNSHGLELELETVNRDALLDRACVWIAEPTVRGWSMILARGLSTRWLDYRPIFEHIRSSLWWVQAPVVTHHGNQGK